MSLYVLAYTNLQWSCIAYRWEACRLNFSSFASVSTAQDDEQGTFPGGNRNLAVALSSTCRFQETALQPNESNLRRKFCHAPREYED